MELEYGDRVIDQNGKLLGTIDHLVHDTWSGEIKKYVIRREAPAQDLFFSPSDVSEVRRHTVKLSISSEELSQR